jgi:hypothetical protein
MGTLSKELCPTTEPLQVHRGDWVMLRKASMNVRLLDLVRRYRICKLGGKTTRETTYPDTPNHPGTFKTLETLASNSNVLHGLTILGELPDRQMKCPKPCPNNGNFDKQISFLDFVSLHL